MAEDIQKGLENLKNDSRVRTIEGSSGEFSVFLKRDLPYEDRVELTRKYLGEPQYVQKNIFNCLLEFEEGDSRIKIGVYYFPHNWFGLGKRSSKPNAMKTRKGRFV